jgi:hypothetical protein
MHLGHPGFQKTYMRVAERFAWPGMKMQVRDYVAKCKECIERKNYLEAKHSLSLKFDELLKDLFLDQLGLQQDQDLINAPKSFTFSKQQVLPKVQKNLPNERSMKKWVQPIFQV